MQFKLLSFVLIALAAVGCSSQKPKMAFDTTTPVGHPARTMASTGEGMVDLKNVYSMQRSYWSDNRDGKQYYGRFSAFIVKDDMSQEGAAKVIVYLEDPINYDVMNKVVDNNKFLWSGVMAGTEPNLSVNGKNSILIQSGNDGIGRSAWHETITARVLASSGKVEVIGYDYDAYDKLQIDDAESCSYNFLTGKATAKIVKMKNDKVIVRKVKGIKKTIDLNDWTEANIPADCHPQN